MKQPNVQFSAIFNWLLGISVILLLASCSSSTEPENSGNETETYKQIIKTTVNANAAGIDGVFADIFTDEQSRTKFLKTYINFNRYFDDNSGYLFVNDYNGYNIAHGSDLSLEGVNHWELKDSQNKYFVQEMIYNAKNSIDDFIIYYFMNPSTGVNEKKYAYAKPLTGVNYALISGFYLEEDITNISELEKNKQIVKGISNTYAFGSGAVCTNLLTSLDDQTNYFRKFVDHVKYFDDNSGYLFVLDITGLCIAHGTNKALEGTNLSELQDSNNKYFVKEMISIVQNSAEGFIEYIYTNPTTNQEEEKMAYVQRVPGTDYFVGAGVYLGD